MRRDYALALLRYIAAVLDDGDYLNDWRTHLPRAVRGAVTALGKLIAEQGLPRGGGRMLADLLTCGDPTLPTSAPARLITLWHALTRLYDALIAAGVC